MASLKRSVLGLLADADTALDKLRTKLRQRLNLTNPIHICAYRTYGSEEALYVRGRVLEDKNLRRAREDDTLLDNIVQMYKRFASEEVPGAKLKITLLGKEYEAVTDDEGYFHLEVKPEWSLPFEDSWLEAHIEVLESPIPMDGQKVESMARIFIPHAAAEFGIISDMDDTVIESFATDKLRTFRTLITNNARTRMPFEGVAAFYQALQLGPDGKDINPLFYVSSSPWNLYDFLMDFLDTHDIPKAPLILRDTGIDKDKFGGLGHRAHKYFEIENILRTYPKMKFILIGDSGQKDPLIYHEIIKNYADRVLAVYIRDVKLPERAKVVIDISEQLKESPVPMLLIENTAKAAEDAVARGFIMPSTQPMVEKAKEKDNSPAVDAMKKESPEEVKQEIKEEVQEKEEKIHKKGLEPEINNGEDV